MEDVAIVSQDMLRSIRSQVEKNPNNKAAILNASEIDRIKGSTKIETAQEIQAASILAKSQKESALEQSKARKERM